MTAFHTNPVLNPFVLNTLRKDTNKVRDRLNDVLSDWGLASHKLSNQLDYYIVEAVQSSLEKIHEIVGRRLQNKQATAKGSLYTSSISNPALSFTVTDFITGTLKSEFMKSAPKGGIDYETIQIRPMARIWALEILNDSITRQEIILGLQDTEYSREFTIHSSNIMLPIGTAYVTALRQLFDDLGLHRKAESEQRQYFIDLTQDLHGIPLRPPEPKILTMTDGISTEITNLALMYQANLREESEHMASRFPRQEI